MNNIFLSRAQSLARDIAATRRAIHKFGGLEFNLRKSADLISSKLSEWGIRWREVCPCGIVAEIGGGSPVFLLRGDYDALPVEEESGLPFAAENGMCHCCGHDLHAAMLLYAAKMLKEREKEIEGTVRLMFQPDEEGGHGCEAMVKAGVLENPNVDSAMAIHVAVATDFSTSRTVHYSRGPAFAGCDDITIIVKGRGGHGAQPHTAIDPITTAAAILTALQHTVSMEVAYDQRAVLTFGYIHGGSAPNTIPSEVELKGTIRTYAEDIAAFIRGRVREVANDTAKAMRAEAIVDIPVGIKPVCNDPTLCDELKPMIEAITGKEETLLVDYPTSYGSEDFSAISTRVPAVMLKLGAGSRIEGYEYPLHHPRTTFDEAVLPYGAAIYANCAFHWLSKQSCNDLIKGNPFF